jgi:hypothetical protein
MHRTGRVATVAGVAQGTGATTAHGFAADGAAIALAGGRAA